MKGEPAEFEHIAVEASRIGGELLKKYFNNVDQGSITLKKQKDWVSAADHASEEAIIAFLERELPDHSIFTEETGYRPAGECGGEFCWIIDPLDGTTNFLRSFPLWAVSVGVEFRQSAEEKWGRIVAGAVNVPPTGEIFSASVNRGAYRNGSRILVGEGHPLSHSLLGTGFPFRVPELHEQYHRIFKLLLSKCADMRRPGSAAVDLCYTAMGIYDGFWEFDLYPWDTAAGSIIIREAGGCVSAIDGSDDFLTFGDILTANPAIYKELLTLIKENLVDGTFPRQIDKGPLR